ncbi:hypothetical protein [Millisia brevis]|uniref:hypothetical protein n=1 Tax=Millisia brevis TaxID=264148 RepID=UPI0012ED617C|nr:hypothetical protein [Millisia brevis]
MRMRTRRYVAVAIIAAAAAIGSPAVAGAVAGAGSSGSSGFDITELLQLLSTGSSTIPDGNEPA